MSGSPDVFDAVIVGAGIVGAATAVALRKRGLSVVILEKEASPGLEASGRAQGSLRIQGRDASEIDLAIEAMKIYKEEARLASDMGTDFELIIGGNLYLGENDGELKILKGLVADAHKAGLRDVSFLTADEVRKLLPAATGPFAGAMWSQGDGQCQPDKATAHFIRRALDAGAVLRCATTAASLQVSGDRIAGVQTSRGLIQSSRVVLCGGIWAPYLAAPHGIDLPVMPLYLSELQTTPLPPLFEQVIRSFTFGGRQRRDGRIVLSAGLSAKKFHGMSFYNFYGLRHWLPRLLTFRQHLKLRLDYELIARQIKTLSIRSGVVIGSSEPPFAADRAAVDGALAALKRIFPAAAPASGVLYWTGATDMTPDGLPIIDGDTGIEGLVIATGFSGHGLGIAPVVGEINAELTAGGRSRWPIGAFSADRFRGRSVEAVPQTT